MKKAMLNRQSPILLASWVAIAPLRYLAIVRCLMPPSVKNRTAIKAALPSGLEKRSQLIPTSPHLSPI